MASVIFTDQELRGLNARDLAILHEHVLHHIQTSREIRGMIAQRRRQFVQLHPSIRQHLRSKADPLRKRLLQSAAGGGRKKKGDGRKKKGGGRKKSTL